MEVCIQPHLLREVESSMKAQILGFWWDFNESLGLSDLFRYLKVREGSAEEYKNYRRHLFLGETAKYHTGLFLTEKSNKRFCELNGQEHAPLKISVREVAKGTSLIDFNFFVVHKKTVRGLYQHYHNSCHPTVFSRYCAGQFGSMCEDEIAREVVAKGGSGISSRERQIIEEKYGGPMRWEILVRPQKFEQIVNSLASISGFEFNLATVKAEKEHRYRSFRDISQRIRHCVSFSRDTTVARRAKEILAFVKNNKGIGDAAVKGVDESGLERMFSLYDNPDSFGTYEFDRLAENMVFEPKDFATSVFMQELIRVADANASVLEKKAQ